MSVAVLATAAAAGAVAGLGSIPHCMGMCGPLVAGVCAGPREGVSYQLGRSASYAALGAISGSVVALGTRPLPTELVAQLTSAAMALGLVWVAARLVLGAVARTGAPGAQAERGARHDGSDLVELRRKRDPGLGPDDAEPAASSDLAPDEPRGPAPERGGSGLGGRWARLVRPVLGSPLLVGALSALLPCGALLNMTVLAGASGAPLAGATTGLTFALVTGGGLAASAWAGSLLRQTRAGSLLVASVLLLGAAIVVVRGFPQLLRSTEEGVAPACHDEPLATLPQRGARP